MNHFAVYAGLLAVSALAFPLLASSAAPLGSQAKLKVAVVQNNSDGPRYMAEGGLVPLLDKLGCELEGIDTIVLTPEEQREYGEWNRDALESRRIGQLAGKNRVGEGLIIWLLRNCSDLLGMLAGLQHLRPSGERGGADERGLQRGGLTGLKPFWGGLNFFGAHREF